MHFPIAPQIVTAFIERAGGTFDYTQMDGAYTAAVLNWMKTRRQWDVPKDYLINDFGTMQTTSIGKLLSMQWNRQETIPGS
jgi:cysteine-S-conjugate beta-lyase